MRVLKNYLLNVSYQLLVIILPIITVPYITRIFTPNQIGVNAYTLSIAQYFVLFAGLGVGIYGNRTIAYIKDDELKKIKTFWSIFFTVLMTTIISLFLYFTYVSFFVKENLHIYFIQSIYIFSVAIDISWLFMGLEEFKKIVTRNTIVKVVGMIAIFMFVKSSEDLTLYILIMALMNLFGLASMWIYVPRYIKGFYFNIPDIMSHLLPLIKIYIPQVAIQVYVIMDKTMIGILANESEVAYYDMSQKIVKIVLSIVTSLGVVMIPHISNLLANKKYKEVEKNIGSTFGYMSYLAFPMAFGLSMISKGLAYWFFGIEFAYTGYLMSFSSFIIIAITWSNIIGMQLLMPMMKEREFTISVVSGAITNIIINIILISKLGAFGAIIATIIAEFTVTIVQILIVRKYINVISHILATWKSLISAGLMYFIVTFLTHNMSYNIMTTILQVILGILIYLIIMWVLKSDIQQEALDKVKELGIKIIKKD
ncbi:polysaccharide biosynthesis C-terminal domain-containing protein [Turicibacter sanguinis]|uniref:oligosaccharide flippase family protein n=1 Tax=Turicibacter sanguinis TaxID=154288 RepID=UPI0018A96232|nr:polysaccharide biosynthesis C-terminal domain-containing protein [Turicibacter sanguinis]MDB8558548.1 polysaccharide biosynthesis C-terminal domain-containing protein [Turicibacter sanguinis]MDB8561344.1 polysaccharide biosynthesis C-terminal domain-containing protein [Turicibacter sanguinis]